MKNIDLLVLFIFVVNIVSLFVITENQNIISGYLQDVKFELSQDLELKDCIYPES
jgi:hypothetical protein